jgi:hypothetical protein
METLFLLLVLALPQSSPSGMTAEGHVSITAPIPLAFGEVLEPTPAGVRPSARLRELAGRRVQMVGFMAQMEIAPRGAFYLCAHPVFAAEGGGGTADLPPNTVRVVVRSASGQEFPFIPGPLETTGTLEVGRREEDDGSVSFVRLILDRPEDIAPNASEPPKPSK